MNAQIRPISRNGLIVDFEVLPTVAASAPRECIADAGERSGDAAPFAHVLSHHEVRNAR